MNQSIRFPKTSRGDKTFQKIVRAAEDLFFEKGYHQTNISDITQRAGIALGTFYIYFDDKYAVYGYIQKHFYHQIRESIARSLTGQEDRLEMERIGLKEFLKFIQRHPHTYNILWEALYIDKSLFLDYYENFAERYVRSLQMSQPTVHELEEADFETMAWALMGIANFIGLKYVLFQESSDEELDQVVDRVIRMLRGVLDDSDET